jgi:hypothetical protein
MIQVRKTLAIMAFLTALSAANQISTPCLAAGKEHQTIEQSMVIKAPVKLVFEGIQMSRMTDPEKRHLVSHHQEVAVIDEKLGDLPVIGSAHLVYKEIEVPFKRIDYLLVSSDKFKAFEGSWELTPLENGQATRVCLKSYSDLKIFVPFAKELTLSSTMKDINRRLGNLKHWCDQQRCNDPADHQEVAVHPESDAPHNQSRLAENHLHTKVHADMEEGVQTDKTNEEHK